MENNIIKEKQLDLLPKNEIATIVEINMLPVAKDKKDLLPAIIRKDALALIEIKREFYNVKKQRSEYGLVWFFKSIARLTAKLIRFLFLGVTRLTSFAIFSIIVILSTTIITKNVVNSLNGIKVNKVEDETTGFSIYSIKDDVEAKAKAEMTEPDIEEESSDVTYESDNSDNLE